MPSLGHNLSFFPSKHTWEVPGQKNPDSSWGEIQIREGFESVGKVPHGSLTFVHFLVVLFRALKQQASNWVTQEPSAIFRPRFESQNFCIAGRINFRFELERESKDPGSTPRSYVFVIFLSNSLQIQYP